MGEQLKVVYTGDDPLPDTFKDHAQALADGKLGADGVFHANQIQAKCASKYEAAPPPANASKPYDNYIGLIHSHIMENVGALAILLAFCFAIYAVVASLVGKWAKRPLLILSAERAVYCVWVLLTTAVALVLYALFTSDFRLVHVYENSNLAMAPDLQVHGAVGRHGRLAAAVVVAAADVRGRGGVSEPA